MNTVEFAVRDGIPYAIDFLNPACDLDSFSIGEEAFQWALTTLADLAIDYARNGAPRTHRYAWQQPSDAEQESAALADAVDALSTEAAIAQVVASELIDAAVAFAAEGGQSSEVVGILVAEAAAAELASASAARTARPWRPSWARPPPRSPRASAPRRPTRPMAGLPRRPASAPPRRRVRICKTRGRGHLNVRAASMPL